MHIFTRFVHFVKCFNRYMVECEYKATGTARHVVTVLIDTWWNVNMPETETQM